MQGGTPFFFRSSPSLAVPSRRVSWSVTPSRSRALGRKRLGLLWPRLHRMGDLDLPVDQLDK